MFKCIYVCKYEYTYTKKHNKHTLVYVCTYERKYASV